MNAQKNTVRGLAIQQFSLVLGFKVFVQTYLESGSVSRLLHLCVDTLTRFFFSFSNATWREGFKGFSYTNMSPCLTAGPTPFNGR